MHEDDNHIDEYIPPIGPDEYVMHGGSCAVGSCMTGGGSQNSSWQKRRSYAIPTGLLFTNGPMCTHTSTTIPDIDIPEIKYQESVSSNMIDDDVYDTLISIMQQNVSDTSTSPKLKPKPKPKHTVTRRRSRKNHRKKATRKQRR